MTLQQKKITEKMGICLSKNRARLSRCFHEEEEDWLKSTAQERADELLLTYLVMAARKKENLKIKKLFFMRLQLLQDSLPFPVLFFSGDHRHQRFRGGLLVKEVSQPHSMFFFPDTSRTVP